MEFIIRRLASCYPISGIIITAPIKSIGANRISNGTTIIVVHTIQISIIGKTIGKSTIASNAKITGTNVINLLNSYFLVSRR